VDGWLDIIYSCQDYALRSGRLFSLPSKIGNCAGALGVARVSRWNAALPWDACQGVHLGWLSALGVVAVLGLLLYEHSLVKADDLSRVDAAHFTVNGYVSVLFFSVLGRRSLFFEEFLIHATRVLRPKVTADLDKVNAGQRLDFDDAWLCIELPGSAQ